MAMWTCAGVLLALAAHALCVTRDQFYPHGPGIDQELPRGAEIPSPEVPLQVPIRLYGETYDSIFVNNFGVLSFRADIPTFLNTEFPLPYASIAAFYTNIDTTESGAVYYRETDDKRVLLKSELGVHNHFNDYVDFHPTRVFVATWLDVTYGPGADRKNSFQIAVISNGTESFVEFLYPEREIQWIQRETQPGSLPDAKAQAGFVAEDGRMFTLMGSGSHRVRNIAIWSNVDVSGQYVFRVGDIPQDGNIAVPDQYNPITKETEYEFKNCIEGGPSVCHFQARCVDYQRGICCQCNEGFYGNGKSCVKDDVPLRVHGKLNGEINNVPVNDVDIQAYIVVADGRAYTALSQAPTSLGGSLQLLNILGGVIGWLFAKPVGNTANGYQLTGALFNHSAEIFFPDTNDRVVITQEYLGHDVFDQITLDAEIRGTIPIIAPGAKLEVTEYEEQYTIVEFGVIRVESNRTFVDKISGERYEQIISQLFTYSSCPHSQTDNDVPATLKVSRNFLGYESRDNIVRYGMSNKVIPLGQEDPCVKGRASCGRHSSCVVKGDSFTCVCQSGYTSSYEENSYACIDVDECTARTDNCDPNAECYNHDGGFRCRCRPGFEGDGVRCTPISRCQSIRCDVNAQCVDNLSSEPTCVCNSGFSGDGKNCWLIREHPCDACSSNAECVENYENESGYACECKPGYVGDGINCADEASSYYSSTSPNVDPVEADYNETVVLPNCGSYGCTCPTGYTSYSDGRNNLCRLDRYDVDVSSSSQNGSSGITCSNDQDCPPNAVCSYSKSNGAYECACLEGYEGDGYECIERSGRTCSCNPNAHCITTAADEQICICDPGYHGDGYVCQPNFGCSNNSDCEYNAECQPDPATGDYVCQCVEGYTKDANDACILDGVLCNGAVCAEHASCQYDETLDLHYCHCDPGYEGEAIEQCLPQGQTCDVANVCSPYADCIRNEFTLEYDCACKENYVGNGYTCTPEPTCKNNPYLCDTHAACLKRSGGYVCECNAGYFGNGSAGGCQLPPRQVGNNLVASDGMFIYRVPFQSSREVATPINTAGDQMAVAIDVDCQTGRVYWSDLVSLSIKRSAYDGSNFEFFLIYDVQGPEGISIDWVARNIFWTDPRKRSIEVANLDTKLRKVLYSGEGIMDPRGIAVHPRRGILFWSDWNRQAPKIEWANMDGSARGIFLASPDVSLPNSLAIDWATDRLCYADAGLKSIECVSIETKQRETIATNCTYPFGLAIYGDRFYWTDWKKLRIEYIDSRSQVKGHLPISTASRKLFGVALASEQCPNLSNVCQYQNGNCGLDELCLPDGAGGRSCVRGV